MPKSAIQEISLEEYEAAIGGGVSNDNILEISLEDYESITSSNLQAPTTSETRVSPSGRRPGGYIIPDENSPTPVNNPVSEGRPEVQNDVQTRVEMGADRWAQAETSPGFTDEEAAIVAQMRGDPSVPLEDIAAFIAPIARERGLIFDQTDLDNIQRYRDELAAGDFEPSGVISYRSVADELLGPEQEQYDTGVGDVGAALEEGMAYNPMGIVTRQIYDWADAGQSVSKDELRERFPDLSDDEIETIHDSLIGENRRRELNNARYQVEQRDIGPGLRIAGNIVGGASPVDIVPIGRFATAPARLAAGAALNSAADIAMQGQDIAYGAQDEYRPEQTAISAAAGTAIQGGIEGLSRLIPRGAGAASAEPTTASPAAAAPEADVVTRMTEVMRGARRQSRTNAASLAEFRSNQARALAEARNRPGLEGEERLNAELAALKGSADREALDIRGQFTENDINELFNRIDTSPAFRRSVFGSLNAKVGLRKIFEGEVPTPSEMKRLSQVFPPDFIKSALGMRGDRRILDGISNTANLPRAMMATADLSAPLRQGIVFSGRKEFYTALPTMFREFRDGFLRNDKTPVAERGQNWQSSGSTVLDEIRSRRSYDDMEESGLALTNPYDHTIANREEDFMSNLAERIPGFGRLARGSNAAYAGFLNKLRADVFDTLTAGQNLSREEMAGVSRFINSATGRGDLGSLNRAAPILNAAFFSPRLIKARVDMLNPVFYARLPPVARRAAMADMLKFGGLVTTVLTLASLGGAEVETDPRSSDFAKVKIGNTRLDIAGGFPQYVTLAARLATGETKSLKGNVRELNGDPFNGTRLDVAARFLRNKSAPVPAYAMTAMAGTNPVGEEYDPVDTTARMFIPLYVQGLEDVMQEETISTRTKVAIAIASLFGVGSQSFDANAPRGSSSAPTESETPADTTTEAPSWATEEPAPAEPLEDTTAANVRAVDILSGMGLTPTDSGIRSREEQAEYYNSTSGVSRPGTSPHEVGNAVDIRVPTGISPDEIVAQFQAEGYEGVTIITKQHGTGPHWHIQWESAPQ